MMIVAGDVGGQVGREEHSGPRDILGFAEHG